ncbi:MAG: hypothetical protein WC236_08295 [Gallionellaceae bacterium]|jgi:hypothetical protein
MKMAIRLTAILFSVMIAATAFAADKPHSIPLDIGKGGKCVEEPMEMRKIHMNLLKHQRDETMHKGIRGQKHSLADCVECHAGKETNNVLGSDKAFCQGCHTYAAVKLDCFECHTSKRKVPAEARK